MSFLIAQAWAATDSPATPATTATTAAPGSAATLAAPSTVETFGLNMLLILILVALFYVLLIIPQQKRFKKHRAMLDSMKKGDKILTAAGFVGTVDKITAGDDEVIVDLGNGIKVTALRSTIQSRVDTRVGKTAKGA
jgi:preprotein translocase subunit YajC